MKTTSMISMSPFTTLQKLEIKKYMSITYTFTSTLSRQRNVTIVTFYYQHNTLLINYLPNSKNAK